MRRTFPLVLVLMVAIFTGCTKRVEVPPLTPSPTNTNHIGKFVWFDLLTDDVETAKQFYGELFGWQFQDNGDDNPIYTTVLDNGLPIGGIVASDQLKQEVKSSRWLSYLSVPDVDAAVAYIEAQGGTVHAKGTDFPQRGRVAVVNDPQGALLAFVQSSTGDPVDTDPSDGRWFWIELWTSDVKAATNVYHELVGYEEDTRLQTDVGETQYHVMRRDDQLRAGMLEIPFDGVLPNWVPYVMVDNPADVAKNSESLGGRILVLPEGEYHGGSAIISDPTGGVFGVQKWTGKLSEGTR